MSGVSQASASPADPWLAFLHRARPDFDPARTGAILCLDPGETTGWALWWCGELVGFGQEATPDPSDIASLIRSHPGLNRIVYEEYRIRGNKAKEHVGSEVITIQHIGAIKVVASALGIRTYKQTAGVAKAFATDAKLKRWNLYQPGYRHANDAIRHGCRYLLFVAGRKGSHA